MWKIFAVVPWRRVWAVLVMSGMTNVGVAAVPGSPVAASSAPAVKWIDSWGASYLSTTVMGSVQNTPTIDHQTMRFIVFNGLAGTQARVKFTNKFDQTPLEIGAAHLAVVAQGAGGSAIDPKTDRALTFEGKGTVTLAPGGEVWSDAVVLDMPLHRDVAVSIYVPATRKPMTFHPTALKTSYISGPGDFTGAADLAPAATGTAPASAPGGRGGGRGVQTTDQWQYVAGIQVMASAKTKVIVALGDSITDGATSAVNGNASWPSVLAKRLPALADGTPVSVINMGIGSNRVVSAEVAGPSGLKRLAEDVLARPNVTHLIVMEGINDISYEQATPEQLIKAYEEIIAQAHAKGIKVYGATLLPIQNSRKDTPENEATRQAVNKWVREGGAYDGVLDFEKVVQDPANSLRIRRELTSDYVHPNSAGYRLMGESIDLKVFE